MKNLKIFDTKEEMDQVLNALEKEGIQAKGKKEGSEYTIYVHVGNFIKARDILLDTNAATTKQEIDS